MATNTCCNFWFPNPTSLENPSIVIARGRCCSSPIKVSPWDLKSACGISGQTLLLCSGKYVFTFTHICSLSLVFKYSQNNGVNWEMLPVSCCFDVFSDPHLDGCISEWNYSVVLISSFMSIPSLCIHIFLYLVLTPWSRKNHKDKHPCYVITLIDEPLPAVKIRAGMWEPLGQRPVWGRKWKFEFVTVITFAA